ncbi:MAG: DNA repair protein RecN [Bacteroidales bacterium]
MLQSLEVNNYALIERTEISFERGLTVITGETGAGKSILLGALSLILGERADTSAISDKSKKCVVEASFKLESLNLKAFFADKDIDYMDITTIRREISAEGKSRAFVNDTPVNLNCLKELGGRLIDLHSQHQNLNLGDSEFQLAVLDSLAENHSLLNTYKEKYVVYKAKKNALGRILKERDKSLENEGYIRFQYNQLAQIKINSSDFEELEQEMNIMSNAEEIKQALAEANNALDNEDSGASASLNLALCRLDKLAAYSPKLSDLTERINGALIEVQDIVSEIDSLNSNIEYDSNELDKCRDTIDLVNSMLHKHKVGSISELIAIREQHQSSLSLIENFDLALDEAQKELETASKDLDKISSELTKSRKSKVKELEKVVLDGLFELSMQNSVFQVNVSKIDGYTEMGQDAVSFLFSANRGVAPQEISKIASGGELSRFMLCIKLAMNKEGSIPTIIFDEIDTGISGDVALKMGKLIKALSQKVQVINITHLPQIAAYSDHHWFVFKYHKSSQNKDFSGIEQLNEERRIVEIAKMLSGDPPSEAAKDNAKSLLSMCTM